MVETTRIAAPAWMDAGPTRALLRAAAEAGIVCRFAGGCVRDAILGRAVQDIDIATPAEPASVAAALEPAGMRIVPTGIDHGTVTAVIDGAHFEITTLRRDIETDGRRAKVAFTDDWAEDAARRDFTINALFADPPEGGHATVHDYCGGLADLKARLVRFVGDPDRRIREDRLRLLRFFRFHAHFAGGGPDAEGLAAAIRHASGLDALSGERIRNEILRLLEAPDPVPTLRLMAAHGVLEHALDDAAQIDRLAALVKGPAGAAGDALLRLGALLADGAAVAARAAARLKLSKVQARRLAAMLAAGTDPEPDDTGGWQRMVYTAGRQAAMDRLALRWVEAPGAGDWAALHRLLTRWRSPVFPLKGRDVTARNIVAGPRVGALLAEVEAWWVARGFTDDREACLARLDILVAGG